MLGFQRGLVKAVHARPARVWAPVRGQAAAVCAPHQVRSVEAAALQPASKSDGQSLWEIGHFEHLRVVAGPLGTVSPYLGLCLLQVITKDV